MAYPVLLIEISPEFSIVGYPPTAWTGSPYSYAFQSVGGEGTVTWSLDGGTTLPSGWTLSAAGTLAHASVTGVGSFEFSILATDTAFRSVGAKVRITKAAPLP